MLLLMTALLLQMEELVWCDCGGQPKLNLGVLVFSQAPTAATFGNGVTWAIVVCQNVVE